MIAQYAGPGGMVKINVFISGILIYNFEMQSKVVMIAEVQNRENRQ